MNGLCLGMAARMTGAETVLLAVIPVLLLAPTSAKVFCTARRMA